MLFLLGYRGAPQPEAIFAGLMTGALGNVKAPVLLARHR